MLQFNFFLIFFLVFASPAWAAKIAGTVKAFGAAPSMRPMANSTDRACPGAVYPDFFELGDNNGLANVLVYVKSGLSQRSYAVSNKPVVVDQVGCRYKPHVFAAMIGQPVVFRSQDQTTHTVDVHSQNNGSYGITIPANFPGGAKRFEKEEYMFPLMCSLHPWMLAFGNILPHPYFFVTEGQGRYLINDLPPGTYELEAWHEKLGKKSQAVTIAPDQQLATVDFEYRVR
jgi:plastocyanin